MSNKELIEQLANEHLGIDWYNHVYYEDLEAFAKAYAQTQGQSIPDGWKLVPIEPTEEMLDAVAQKPHSNRTDGWRSYYRKKYKAMLSAAPIESGVKG